MCKLKSGPILLTGGAMREVEMAAMEAGEARGIDLMEIAGHAVVDAMMRKWPELQDSRPRRAAILCGPGNNGGDGFVVARLLKQRGWTVDLGLLGRPESLPPDAARNHGAWREVGEVQTLESVAAGPGGKGDADVVVDAFFGTGLARPLSAEIAQILTQMLTVTPRRVAVDILSGLCADSGRALGGVSVGEVDLTVTFQTLKPGHLLDEGATAMREVQVADIGLGERADVALQESRPGASLLLGDEAPCVRMAQKAGGGHKYNHGHALVLSGGPGRTGAARLAARAALRVGAGLVTMAVPPAAQLEVACQVTAIMVRRAANAEDMSVLLQDLRYNSICLGPGMGADETGRQKVAVALAAKRSVVLDADALTSFEADPEVLFEKLRGGDAVLTPHEGEFARLFPDLAERMHGVAGQGPAYSRIDAVRAAAERAGVVVLLKGAVTVIAGPDGQCLIHDALRARPAPWLATAGSGDVLSGLIAGLMARGSAPIEAAAGGAWLHAEAARQFGPGLIAEDLPEQLPGVLAMIASGTDRQG